MSQNPFEISKASADDARSLETSPDLGNNISGDFRESLIKLASKQKIVGTVGILFTQLLFLGYSCISFYSFLLAGSNFSLIKLFIAFVLFDIAPTLFFLGLLKCSYHNQNWASNQGDGIQAISATSRLHDKALLLLVVYSLILIVFGLSLVGLIPFLF